MEAKKATTFTRTEAARVLGCSRTRVQQFEKDGRLCAVVDQSGVHHFARADVLALARARGRTHADRVHGTIAAEVFAMFRESVELPEIVMRTQQSPATIRALYEEYSRPLGHRPEAPVDLAEYERSSRALDEKIAAMQGQPPLVRANGSSGQDVHARACGGQANGGRQHARDK
jgi:hypothetical protein